MYDQATAAVAICHDCGAGVCLDHAIASVHHLTRVIPLGRYVPVEPPARMVRCTTCAAAVAAARTPLAAPAAPRFRGRHHAGH